MQFAGRWLEKLRERRFYIFFHVSLVTVFSSYCSGKEFVSYKISRSQQFYPPTK